MLKIKNGGLVKINMVLNASNNSNLEQLVLKRLKKEIYKHYDSLVILRKLVAQ